MKQLGSDLSWAYCSLNLQTHKHIFVLRLSITTIMMMSALHLPSANYVLRIVWSISYHHLVLKRNRVFGKEKLNDLILITTVKELLEPLHGIWTWVAWIQSLHSLLLNSAVWKSRCPMTTCQVINIHNDYWHESKTAPQTSESQKKGHSKALNYNPSRS